MVKPVAVLLLSVGVSGLLAAPASQAQESDVTPPSCDLQDPFFAELAPDNSPVPLPEPGDVVEISRPSQLLYKTELSNVAGSLLVCAVSNESPVFASTLVEVILDESENIERVPLNSCAVFTARQIDMLAPSGGTASSRARVCLIETVTFD